jgi:hypothetical protein
MISILIFAFVCAFACSCVAPPRILVSQAYVGDRSVQYLMQKAGDASKDKKKVQLFNFSMRICNITDEGKESDCKETPVLRNVQSKPVY